MPSQKVRRYLFVAIVWTSLLAPLSVALAYFEHTTQQSLDREARLQQRERGRELATQLDTRLAVSEQIASTLAALASGARDRSDLEQLLRRVLASTSNEFVYGVGVWFEPWRFDPKTRLFGPYAHRTPESAAVITYEWSAEAYDYPAHAWYKLGRASAARPGYSEPYFDVDYVYMTTTRAFFDDKGAVLGVVSVDLILPQLQDIVARANHAPSETFYVTTHAGALFAHPAAARLLDFARAHGKTPRTLLDLHESDLRAFEAASNAKPRTETTTPIGRAGWTVHVSTQTDQLFAASASLGRSATIATVLLFGLFGASAIAYTRWRSARDLAREIAAYREIERGLEESVRVRDDFLAIAAHELKTPLTPLSMRLQLLLRQARAARPVDVGALEKALSAADRLAQLVDDLLDTARVHAGRLELTKETTALAALVRETIANVAPLSARHRILLEVDDEELRLRADRRRIEQVVTNLVVNAIKYSPRGGDVRVKIERRADEAVISVADEGIGIPSGDLAHVFDRYFRSTNAPATSFAGLGLGLFICRGIVEQHGGRMWAQSEEGKGSTFLLTLPLGSDAPREPRDATRPRPPTTTQTTTQTREDVPTPGRTATSSSRPP